MVAAICYAMLRVDGADLFPAASQIAPVTIAPVQTVAEDANDQKLVDVLMRLMGDERIYRHDNITSARSRPNSGSPNTDCGG